LCFSKKKKCPDCEGDGVCVVTSSQPEELIRHSRDLSAKRRLGRVGGRQDLPFGNGKRFKRCVPKKPMFKVNDQVEIECETCHGVGVVSDGGFLCFSKKKKCPDCEGDGVCVVTSSQPEELIRHSRRRCLARPVSNSKPTPGHGFAQAAAVIGSRTTSQNQSGQSAQRRSKASSWGSLDDADVLPCDKNDPFPQDTEVEVYHYLTYLNGSLAKVLGKDPVFPSSGKDSRYKVEIIRPGQAREIVSLKKEFLRYPTTEERWETLRALGSELNILASNIEVYYIELSDDKYDDAVMSMGKDPRLYCTNCEAIVAPDQRDAKQCPECDHRSTNQAGSSWYNNLAGGKWIPSSIWNTFIDNSKAEDTKMKLAQLPPGVAYKVKVYCKFTSVRGKFRNSPQKNVTVSDASVLFD